MRPAYETINARMELLGLELDPEKGEIPAREIELVGAFISCTPGATTASLPEAKRDAMVTDLEQIRASDTIGTAEAAKIRGELGYFRTLMFGRAGRAMLHPFTERQYNARSHSRSTMSPSLKEVTPWWIDRLNAPDLRHVSTVKQKPVLVYADASGDGQISAIAIVGGVRHAAHTHSPGRFVRSGASILELELLAELLGLMIACEVAPGRPALLCCDKSGAAAAVIRGSRHTAIGRIIASVFWAVASTRRCPVWVEGVASGLNPEDGPSSVPTHPLERRFLGEIESKGAPTAFFMMCGSRRALAAAQFLLPTQVKGRPQAWQCCEHKHTNKESTPCA